MQEKLAALHWKYAKTYPDAPHEYILQEWDAECFKYLKDKIETEGKWEPFTLRGRTYDYRYYYPGDGFRYWVIENVLNRCKVDGAGRPIKPDEVNID